MSKISQSGTGLEYSHWFGGSRSETGSDIAVDTEGNAYIAGSTNSLEFPQFNGLPEGYHGDSCSCADAFVVKLNAAGNALLYSTLLGGGNEDADRGIALSSDGTLYVSGSTASSNFTLKKPLQNSLNGPKDAFVAHLDTLASGAESLLSSTYVGEATNDDAFAIAVDEAEAVSITGVTDRSGSAHPYLARLLRPLQIRINDPQKKRVKRLALNQDGWPALNTESGAAANPITITVTLRNLTDAPQHYLALLSLGSSENKARFYIFDSPCDAVFDQFSYTQIDDDCGVQLQPGETATLEWGLWVQPSAAATLIGSAELRLVADGSLVAAEEARLRIPEAQIHPLVFLHGILGSMAPENLLVTDEDTLHKKLDPFLGSYWPLPDQLQKIGYEWNKTLFVLAYDWRQPVDVSADFLAGQLRDAVIPRSRPSAELPYTAPAPKADLIGHSMGGLVARSYIQRPTGYQSDVRKLIFVASPHKGFPFDYQTWEGLTWQDYLYNAEWYSGGLLGTLSSLMDSSIWPALIYKRYKPSDAELALDCKLYRPDIYDPNDPNPFFFALSSRVETYKCSKNTLAKWAHSIDVANSGDGTNRGIRSLFEMLPSDDLALPAGLPTGKYLSDLANTPDPFGHQQNTFLRDLNSQTQIQRLTDRLGPANVFNIYGDNAPTDVQYQVAKSGATIDQPDLWRNGMVNDPRIVSNAVVVEQDAGDDLIPASSMALDASGLLPLPTGNEQVVDDKESRQKTLGPARHKEILSQTQVQTEFIPRFLGMIGANDRLPFQVKPGLAPLALDLPPEFGNIGRMNMVISDCPINLLITDPMGRRLGYDPATGQMLREIPGAVATSPFVEPHILLISNPITGTYQVTASGYDTGAYGIIVDDANLSGVTHAAFFSGLTTSGQINDFTFTYTPTASFPATPIRDDFSRPDGPLGANWAGDSQEYEIQGQALRPSGGSGAIYWDTPFGSDQEAYVTLSAIDANAEEIDLLLKGQGIGQCDVLEAWYQPSRGTVQVWTCQDFGNWTQHGSDIPVTFAAGDRFGVRAKADGTVEVYKNGSLVGSVTVSTTGPFRSSGGRIGIWTINAPTAVLDSFGGGSLP